MSLLMDDEAINYTDVINCPTEDAEKMFNDLDIQGEVLWTRQNKKRGHRVTVVKYENYVAIVQCLRINKTYDGDCYKNSVVFLESEHDAQEVAKTVYKYCFGAAQMVTDFIKEQNKDKNNVMEVEG